MKKLDLNKFNEKEAHEIMDAFVKKGYESLHNDAEAIITEDSYHLFNFFIANVIVNMLGNHIAFTVPRDQQRKIFSILCGEVDSILKLHAERDEIESNIKHRH